MKHLALAAPVALLAATILIPLTGTEQIAPRQTPGSRIHVTQCEPHQHTAGSAFHPWIDPYGYWHRTGDFPYRDGFLAVTYMNNAPVPATEVDFGLVARGSLVAAATDKGTFSQGVPISHEFTIDPNVFPIGTSFPYCAVLRVRYANGREWDNPRPPQGG
jgi:hypothetical protein